MDVIILRERNYYITFASAVGVLVTSCLIFFSFSFPLLQRLKRQLRWLTTRSSQYLSYIVKGKGRRRKRWEGEKKRRGGGGDKASLKYTAFEVNNSVLDRACKLIIFPRFMEIFHGHQKFDAISLQLSFSMLSCLRTKTPRTSFKHSDYFSIFIPGNDKSCLSKYVSKM